MMMNGPDVDQRLVQASLAGDAEAYGELVRRHQDRLYATLYRLTGSSEEALDLVQDTFLRAYQKLDHFLGGSAFYTWLYRIGVNLALNRRRRWKSGPRFVSFNRTGEVEHTAGDPAESDPARPLERAELEQQVHTALQRLPEDFRAVIVLKDLDGLRYEEIAEVLNIPVGTVRSRLHRARGDLRNLLRKVMEPATPPASLHTHDS